MSWRSRRAKGDNNGDTNRGPRPMLVAALAISVVVHLALSFWPVPPRELEPEIPLQATITELPPPPSAAPALPQKRARPRVSVARTPRAMLMPPAPEAQHAPELAPAPEIETAPLALAETLPEIASPAAEDRPVLASPPEFATATLPPRVDLAYRVFLGTQGFYIGDATYRFEHTGERYRIHSVGEARGLAALILRGQGKIESEGAITPAGLKPDAFALVRGAGRKREVARFDWKAGQITLDDDKAEPLEPPTYDPLAFLWQFYFMPPTESEQTFAIATTRRVYHYTFTREATESLQLPSGAVETERWHRRSDDGKTDAYVWLAPKLHHVAVKLRFANTERGTVEAVLDAIRVDEPKGTP
ncbi:MAG: DUF3108 domain-containing protein [Pseudomonadota bacterium]|nr:DUF3108 domain-containing protein [Pseudomonadota bacterium]